MSERVKFESTYLGRFDLRHDMDAPAGYYSMSTNAAWVAWQDRAAIAAASQQAAQPKAAMTDAQRKQLSRCLNGGVHMGWISDIEANDLGDAIEAASGPNAAMVEALQQAKEDAKQITYLGPAEPARLASRIMVIVKSALAAAGVSLEAK